MPPHQVIDKGEDSHREGGGHPSEKYAELITIESKKFDSYRMLRSTDDSSREMLSNENSALKPLHHPHSNLAPFPKVSENTPEYYPSKSLEIWDSEQSSSARQNRASTETVETEEIYPYQMKPSMVTDISSSSLGGVSDYKAAYKDQRVKRQFQEQVVDTLTTTVDQMHFQVEEYHELLNTYEVSKAENRELKMEIHNVTQDFQNQKKILIEEIDELKIKAKKKDRINEAIKLDNAEVRKSMQINRDQTNLTEENDKLRVQLIKLKRQVKSVDNEDIAQSRQIQKEMSEQLVKCKYTLAMTQEKEDWLNLQVRVLTMELAKIRSNAPQNPSDNTSKTGEKKNRFSFFRRKSLNED